MPAASLTHRVFVDFENVSAINLSPIANRPVHVALLIGKNQTKLDLELVRQIHKLAQQVELIEVGAAGRNALDMTLACYLGRAVQQAPGDHFHIISGDKDYDPMVNHLRSVGTSVSRHSTFAALPFLPKPAKAAAAPKKSSPPAPAKPRIDRRPKLIARLSDAANHNRPSTRQALTAHIKTALGKESSEAGVAETIKQLCDRHILTIDAKDKVSYAAAP
jgi:hypothetical protein